VPIWPRRKSKSHRFEMLRPGIFQQRTCVMRFDSLVRSRDDGKIGGYILLSRSQDR
jgi:hypothetical protein